MNKKLKFQTCGKHFTNKWLTTHIERDQHQNESISKVLEKLKIDDVNSNYNNNIQILLVGPSFACKIFLMLKIFSRLPYRDFFIITKSALEQYSKSKIKTRETGEEVKPLNEYENAVIVFDVILGSLISRYKGQFFIKGRHKTLDMYFLSQSCFDWVKKQFETKVTKSFCICNERKNTYLECTPETKPF